MVEVGSVACNPSVSWQSDSLAPSPLQLSAARRGKFGGRFALAGSNGVHERAVGNSVAFGSVLYPPPLVEASDCGTAADGFDFGSGLRSVLWPLLGSTCFWLWGLTTTP